MRTRGITRFTLLTLALVLVWSANPLPTHSSQSAQSATAAGRIKPNDQPASRTVANGKIAFDNHDIFTMNADGSDLKQLTFEEAPTNLVKALWSPDGKNIAFVRVPAQFYSGHSQICVMNADGVGQGCSNLYDGDDDSPAWSPDSTQIAFQNRSLVSVSGALPFFRSDIYAMNADGSNQRNLTNSNSNESASNPSWSPDGMKIAFSRSDRNAARVRVMNADGSNQRDILNGYSHPQAWSPDGSKLLVAPSGTWGIWAVNADGSSLTQVHEPIPSSGYYYDYNPVWSPDGSKVAFSSIFCTDCMFSETSEVMVVNADGSHLTKGVGSYAVSPTWSPDGVKIIFGDWSGVFVMNADGSGVTNVANGSRGPLPPPHPSWQAVHLLPSAIDDPDFFVRQHYRDFLNRDPDPDGLAFWTNEITSCGVDPKCIEVKRINNSASFFLSIEFQETGYLVYRFYKTSHGNLPGRQVPLRLAEFLPDTQQIGQDVIVRHSGWEQKLESNKQAFAAQFVQRSRFVAAYPTSLSSEQFVDALFANAGVTPSTSDRSAAINEFSFSASTADVAARARALRRVAEDSTLKQQEFNRAFVLMQYFGYLRRNPNDEPDKNFDGYDFWLKKLNQFDGNYIRAEMVKAFLSSIEYRRRFGP